MKSVLYLVLVIFTLNTSINCDKNLNSVAPNEYSEAFYPLNIGNQWTYNEQYPNTEIIDDTAIINGKIYYHINGSQIIQPDFYIREYNKSVYFFDSKRDSEHLLFDFNAKSGDAWDMPQGFGCTVGDRIKLISASENVKTPAGIFINCYHFKHETRCMDGGLRDTWFSKGTGIVKSVHETWSGYKEHVLISYSFKSRE